MTVEKIHAAIDHFKPSFEKLDLINQLCHDFQFSLEEYLELLFPIVRYHSRWNSLAESSFHRNYESYKGAYFAEQFFTAMDISQYKSVATESAPLPEFTQKALTKLLDYCMNEGIKVVFVLSAQYRNEQTIKCHNTMIDEIKSYGFPLINEIEKFDEIGLNDKTDFYNAGHTNIHGALKITDYLAQYLLENYTFPEKTGGGIRAGMKHIKSIAKLYSRT